MRVTIETPRLDPPLDRLPPRGLLGWAGPGMKKLLAMLWKWRLAPGQAQNLESRSRRCFGRDGCNHDGPAAIHPGTSAFSPRRRPGEVRLRCPYSSGREKPAERRKPISPRTGANLLVQITLTKYLVAIICYAGNLFFRSSRGPRLSYNIKAPFPGSFPGGAGVPAISFPNPAPGR